MNSINVIKPFTGKHKFRHIGEKERIDEWGNKYIQHCFVPTQQYMKYLREREEQKRKFEITKLKAKLDYEFATTGDVDDVDYQRYCKLIGLSK